jgi:two-component system response regulator MprA
LATILVVDDEDSIRNSLSRFLQVKKHHVVEACDGIEALDVLASNNVDLALVDFVMPRMNGLELIRRMSSEHSDTPILVISAYPDACELDGMKANVVGVLRKPFELRHLADVLESALSERESMSDGLA